MRELTRCLGNALARLAPALLVAAIIFGFGGSAGFAEDAGPQDGPGNPVVAQGACPDDYPVDCGDTCCPEGTECCAAGCCEPCPSDYPVDCGDGGCCPAGTGCCGGGGCCENGFPHYCQGRCYRTLDDAIKAGCSRDEVVVCGAPQ